MEFRYRYQGQSQVKSDTNSTAVSFVPDSLRPATYFSGELHKKLPFREAISALHQVVISDLRFQPKDRSQYQAWLATEEQRLLAEFLSRKQDIKAELERLQQELTDINRQSDKIMQPYYKAQQRYFDYLYKHDMDAWYVLDPVISINPDELFFECFSEDESSYAKLSCSFNAFTQISEQACGTTNIDYSQGLYEAFQKIRNYRSTRLEVDPGGFAVTTDNDEFAEKKIDLPDSWVRGFLQVSSAMTLPGVQVQLHPLDIYNLCFLLRRHKERQGPRAIRWLLEPDQPVRLFLEPWNIELKCPRSIYQGAERQQIRVWGRRRIHILERLIPIADSFTLHLLGDGMPMFFIAHMQDFSFTLGLSGWTANDWSSMGNFDLLAPRAKVDEVTLKRIFKHLQQNWCQSAASLAQELQLDSAIVTSALNIYSQKGLVLYDLDKQLYRIRELSREPLPFNELRFQNDREAKARRFIDAGLVSIDNIDSQADHQSIQGRVMDDGKSLNVKLRIDADQRLQHAECECHFYHQNRLRQGPCEHMLALRLQANEKIALASQADSA